MAVIIKEGDGNDTGGNHIRGRERTKSKYFAFILNGVKIAGSYGGAWVYKADANEAAIYINKV